MEKFRLIDDELFRRVLKEAEASPRLRKNFNFHSSMEENPHRFLNVLCSGTYITPHRHLDPPKTEAFLVLQGELAFFIFNDDGTIAQCSRLGTGPECEAIGIDIHPGVWHSLLCLSDHCVCYEVKPGPYLQSNDKDFATWAPREGSEGCPEYLDDLLAEARRRFQI